MADDLTTITGIAERRARILGDELGVVSFADLAAQDVDTIRAALRRHGQGVTRETVALWIAEAARRSTRPDGWMLTALFLVLYEHRAEQHRTVIRHVDTSDDAEWPGFVTDEPATWIGERLEDRSAPAPPTGPTGEGPDDAPAGVVRVAHVYQPPETARAHPVDEHGNVQRSIHADEPFTVELETLDDDADADIALDITPFGTAEPVGSDRSATTAASGAAPSIAVAGLAPGLYHVHPSGAASRERRRCPVLLVE